MFSYLKKARTENKRLAVIWDLDPLAECNGYFQDIFQPIQGVTMLKENAEYNVDYRGNNIHPKFKLNRYDLNDLQLLPDIKMKVDDICSKIKPYIAIHVRRTDHIEYLALCKNKPTPDEHFFNFIDLHPQYNVYLATDNADTQKMFARKYPGRIFWNIEIQHSDERRKTSLKDAAIDIFVCKDADLFYGSNYSSFSGIIGIMNGFKGYCKGKLPYFYQS
jgi:hypothetical protein